MIVSYVGHLLRRYWGYF